ncbi:notchless protein [Tanacetum coccineum]
MDSMEEANNNSVMCQLSDPEGNPLGASMYLPQLVGPKELQQMVNKLLDNEFNLYFELVGYVMKFGYFLESGLLYRLF